jgi:CRISPR type IV-associated protein Csf3
MEPLKVTFRFCSPIVIDSEHPIHLDALLAWAVVDTPGPLGKLTPWAAGEDLSKIFESHANSNGEWVWKASALKFTPLSEKLLTNYVRISDPLIYLKGFDSKVIESSRPRKFIDRRTGQERAYRFLMPYQWMGKADAWCVGNSDHITLLLKRLTSIGKLTRNGFGLISDVTVDPCSIEGCRWRDRVLPCGVEGEKDVDYVPALRCLRPPYWHKTHRVMAMAPIEKL